MQQQLHSQSQVGGLHRSLGFNNFITRKGCWSAVAVNNDVTWFGCLVVCSVILVGVEQVFSWVGC
jgi:hypothetical protein